MRRLPVFVCVDVSESMAGSALEAVQDGLQTMLLALKKDPMVIEIGAISIISFGVGAKVEVPLSSLLEVKLPNLRLSSGTSLGAAFDLLSTEISCNVRKTTAEARGDYKPIVFIITDGQPTDDWAGPLARLKAAHRNLPIYAIGCGDDIDFSLLRRVTPDCYALRDMGADAFSRLFKCVSASVQSATTSVAMGAELKEDLVEWAAGALEKPKAEDLVSHGDVKQVMLSVTCSTSRMPYLLRYRLTGNGRYACTAAHPLEERLDGGSAKGGEVHVAMLDNPHPCPYCGNLGFVRCSCGELSCVSPCDEEMRCPVCGEHGWIERVQDFSIDRVRG